MQNENNQINTITNENDVTQVVTDNKQVMKTAVMKFGIFAFVYSVMRFFAVGTIALLNEFEFFSLFPITWQKTVTDIIASIFFYIIPLIPCFLLFPKKLYKRRNKTYIGSEYTKPKAFSFYPATYTLGMFTNISTVAILLLIAKLVDFNITSDDITDYFNQGESNIIVQILIVAVFVPIMEEFFFRGKLLGVLRPFGDKFAIFASGLFFGIMHGNILQAPFATVVGFALGYIYVRSNSLAVTIGFHALVNGTSTILSYYSVKVVDFIFDKSEGTSTSLQGLDYVIATVLEWVIFGILICGAISLIRLTIRYIVSGIKKVRVSYLENKYADFSEGKKLGILFSNPFVILAFVVCIYHIASSTIDFINSCNLL